MAGTALPFALNLATIADAAAQTSSSDYKALVCVFLYGGNDYANTVVAYDDTHYNAYSAIRGGGQSKRWRHRTGQGGPRVHAAEADGGAAQWAPIRTSSCDDVDGKAFQ
jgi:hypothetical protein